MKTIHCTNIKPGQTEPCNFEMEVSANSRRQFCGECRVLRASAKSLVSYHLNKKEFVAYSKTCECGDEFLIKKGNRGHKKKCDSCGIFDKKNRHKTKKQTKPDLKSLAKRTKCRCGRCGEIHYKEIHLHEDERRKVDAGRPHRKRCHVCDLWAGRLEYCDESEGHGAAGVM